jgi:hypothetical protein
MTDLRCDTGAVSAPFATAGAVLGRTGVVFLLTLVMMLLGIVWLFVIVPHTPLTTIPCPFEAVSGYECPGCGLQSSLANLFALRWKYVLMANLLSPLLLPLFFIVVISWSAERLFGVVLWRFDAPLWVIIGGVILLVTYGVARNIPSLGVW